MLLCESVMTPRPVTCRPMETVATAAYRMATARVGALPVVDGAENRLVGILTDRNIRLRVLARGLDPRTPIQTVMTRDVVTCLPDDDLYEAIDRMEDLGVQRLPIVDEEGRLVGIVTRDDLTRRVGGTGPYSDFLEEIHAED